jgi:hypothetical protein
LIDLQLIIFVIFVVCTFIVLVFFGLGASRCEPYHANAGRPVTATSDAVAATGGAPPFALTFPLAFTRGSGIARM